MPIVVTRITEQLEFEPGLLEFLEAAAIQPGATLTVTSASPDGTLTVRVGDDYVGIGGRTSERIRVSV